MKETQRKFGLVIVGVLTVVVSAVQAVVNNSLRLPQELEPIAGPLGTGILLALAILAIALIWLQSSSPSQPLTTEQSEQSRHDVLEKMEVRIQDTLAVEGSTPLVLGLSRVPDALAPPSDPLLEYPRSNQLALRLGTRIQEVYEDAKGQLLILGASGSGKTFLLTQLAETLVQEAKQSPQSRIPILFHLSSWTEGQDISDWLIKEMKRHYEVKVDHGQQWIMQGRIIPLFDGLDMVASESLSACVAAINDYLFRCDVPNVVVCCRREDYFFQQRRLQLRQAISVLPLSSNQIDGYFQQAPGRLEGVRIAVKDDQVLRTLVDTPLMLNVVTRTYRDKSAEDLPAMGTLDQRRQQVWRDYVQRMFERSPRGPSSNEEKTQKRPKGFRYDEEKTKQRLQWLAQQLKQHKQEIFYLEEIQPDWLDTKWWIFWLYRFLCMEFFCVLFFISIGSFLTLVGLITGLLTGLVLGVLNTCLKPPKQWRSSQWKKGLWILMKVLLFGIGGGVVFMAFDMKVRLILSYTTLNMGRAGSADLSTLVTSDGIFIGILAGIFGGFIDKLINEQEDLSLQLVEIVSWSWRKAGKTFGIFLFSGLGCGLVVGLTMALIGKSPTRFFGLLLLGGLLGLIFGIAFGFFRGWERQQRQNRQARAKPNQGIRDSVHNMLRIGGISGGIAAFLFMFLFGTTLGQYYGSLYIPLGVVFGILPGAPIGLLCSMLKGGDVCMKHFLLRFLLLCSDRIPWNYPRFLDYAVHRILLVRVGGGYQFFHQSLKVYFASTSSL